MLVGNAQAEAELRRGFVVDGGGGEGVHVLNLGDSAWSARG